MIIAQRPSNMLFLQSFKRKDKATTLGEISRVRIVPEQTINAALLCCFNGSGSLKKQGSFK